MSLPPSSRFQFTPDLAICRVLNGMWQVSGAHGAIDPGRAVDEMFRVTKSGGRCFIAEPRHAVWASIPLFSMWVLASVVHSGNGYCEPKTATVLNLPAFEELFNNLPWKSVRVWTHGRYQYALCEKG